MVAKESFVVCKDLYTSLNKQLGKNEAEKLKVGGSLAEATGEEVQLRSRRNGGEKPRLKEKNKNKNPQLTLGKRILSDDGSWGKGRTLWGQHLDHRASAYLEIVL